jgi:HPt (histidine-containing phosphotransfer) domain-containing protein
VIDPKKYKEFCDAMGADFIGEVIAVFNEDAPELLYQMKAALAAADAELFRRAAHSLKSNSASFGADKLAGLARELEILGKEGSLAAVGDKVALAEVEYQRVQQALQELNPA